MASRSPYCFALPSAGQAKHTSEAGTGPNQPQFTKGRLSTTTNRNDTPFTHRHPHPRTPVTTTTTPSFAHPAGFSVTQTEITLSHMREHARPPARPGLVP